MSISCYACDRAQRYCTQSQPYARCIYEVTGHQAFLQSKSSATILRLLIHSLIPLHFQLNACTLMGKTTGVAKRELLRAASKFTALMHSRLTPRPDVAILSHAFLRKSTEYQSLPCILSLQSQFIETKYGFSDN